MSWKSTAIKKGKRARVSSPESFMVLLSYLVVMVMQIFLPAYLGTQMTYESQKLAFAAYASEWIPQSEPYKRSLRLFVERSNTPIVFTGLKMFPLTLSTFVSPMSREDFVFMICYTIAMTLEIFYPAFLGAELTRESEHLVFSAYCSDWISRPESFKRSLRLMVERAKKPAVITGLKMFRLSLATFTSIRSYTSALEWNNGKMRSKGNKG
ncbi:unnamed protein product [Diatraea saccharalis]|uniref:Odorant receptor n=1 Tax=Diatraea saccharalis TaxID=40085 RepID=A0A9N9WIM5_9NEOP|nr:unnamed protein product [Diatraea saccharalis]